jgi:hypothetical protein
VAYREAIAAPREPSSTENYVVLPTAGVPVVRVPAACDRAHATPEKRQSTQTLERGLAPGVIGTARVLLLERVETGCKYENQAVREST